jgi:hypothetical protein
MRTIARDAAESILEQGYALLPALLSDADRRFACAVHDDLIAAGRHIDNGIWGYTFHSLSAVDTRLCHLFVHPLLIEISGIVLQDRVVLKHMGSRVQDPAQGIIPQRVLWHNHAFTPDLITIPPGDTRRGQRPTRLLHGFYLDGSSPEIGSLVVLPRRYDDPLAPPSADRQMPWPGEIAVVAPPGSVIIFTADLWHTATFGTHPTRRRLTGTQVQAANCVQPHPEDHDFTTPAMEAAKRRHPALAEALRADPAPAVLDRLRR